MKPPPPTQEALLKWVNAFPINLHAQSTEDLNDGKILASILADIDPRYEPDGDANLLQSVIANLTSYIRQYCDDVIFLLGTPGIVAFSGGSGDVIELITLLLMAAIEGPTRANYIRDITTKFDESVQAGLQQIIEHNLQKIKGIKDSVGHVITPEANLNLEQKYAVVSASNAALEAEILRLNTKIEGLQSDHDRQKSNNTTLQDENKELGLKLDALTTKSDLSALVSSLRMDIQDRDDHIASQEATIENNRVILEKNKAEIARLKASNEEVTATKIEMRALRAENGKLTILSEELQRKANTADNFRKKLLSMRDFEGECEELARTNEHLLEQCSDVDRLRKSDKIQRQRIADFEKALGQHEAEIYELTMKKNVLAESNDQLLGRIHSLEFTINQFEEARDNFHDDNASGTSRKISSIENELISPSHAENDAAIVVGLKSQIDVLQKNVKLAENNYRTLSLSYDKQHTQLMSARDELHKLKPNDSRPEASLIANNVTLMQAQKDLSEQLSIKERKISELEQQIHDMLESGLDPEQKKNIQREVDLMNGAWYDLAKRLQSNNVTLQRRSERHSWLNRQRQAVTSTTRR